jgi:GNAT superfamily N-acetyltransferase
MTPEVASPRSVPLDRLVERHAHADATVSIAGVSDYPEVEALARAAAPGEVFKPLTAAVLSWFTERNPAGPGFLVVARSRPGGRLLGHFLFYATRLERWDGSSFREAPAYLYVNLYVAPELRRRGVFTTMLGFGLDVLT